MMEKAIVIGLMSLGAALGVYVATRRGFAVEPESLQGVNVVACMWFGAAVGAMLGTVISAAIAGIIGEAV